MMEMTQELFEKIEAYLEGSLSETELASFKTLIDTNPDLKNEIAIHQGLQDELSNTKAIDFRKKLIIAQQELAAQNNKEKKKSFLLSYWKIAASIIFIIGIFSFFWFQNSTEQDLYAIYYTPYPIGEIKRGADATDNKVLKNILLNYKNQKYQQTIIDLENLVAKEPTNEKFKLCLGNSYLNTDQLTKAKTLFKTFSTENKNYFDAQWFLSLTYLKMDQKDSVIPILKTMTSQNMRYKKSAIDLLKELEER